MLLKLLLQLHRARPQQLEYGSFVTPPNWMAPWNCQRRSAHPHI